MSNLSVWAVGIGAVQCIFGVWMIAYPGGAQGVLRAFPRSVWPGRILSAAAFIWASLLIHEMPVGGEYDNLKRMLWLFCPAAILLVWFYLDEFLAVRSLGGLLLLMPTPVLDVARWHASSWSYLMSAVAYLWIIAGITLVLKPYLLRMFIAYCTATRRRIYGFGAGVLIPGIVFLVLGMLVF